MKILSIIFFSTMISFFVNAQSDSLPTSGIITSGKWHLATLSAMNKTVRFKLKDFNINWVIFNKNGSLEAMESGEKYSGKWTYDKEKNTIETRDRDGITLMQIINISQSLLTVEITEKGGGITHVEWKKVYK